MGDPLRQLELNLQHSPRVRGSKHKSTAGKVPAPSGNQLTRCLLYLLRPHTHRERGGEPGLVDKVLVLHAGSRGFDSHRGAHVRTVHVHAKHYAHNKDGRTAPGVCGNGFVPLSHSGNVVTRIGIHTHT